MKELYKIEGIIKVTDEWTGSDTIDGLLIIGDECVMGARSSDDLYFFKNYNGKHISIIISEPEESEQNDR